MTSSKIVCFRCLGRKKVYSKCGGYSLSNTGGIHIDCPLCMGEGKIDSLENAAEKIHAAVTDVVSNTKVTKKSTKKEEKTLELYSDTAT